MSRSFDFIPQIVNGHDFEVHESRGNKWDFRTTQNFEYRKAKIRKLLRNGNVSTVFELANHERLPVLVVRDLFSEYEAECRAVNK